MTPSGSLPAPAHVSAETRRLNPGIYGPVKSAQMAQGVHQRQISAPEAEKAVNGKETHGDRVFWRFTIPGDVCGKPRQTQSDRWKKRPAVLRYRAWADAARAAAPADLPKSPLTVSLVAHLRVPKSYSLKKAKSLAGQPHRQKPDLDNLIKCLDALFDDDKGIATIAARKVWTLEYARLEVEVSQ